MPRVASQGLNLLLDAMAQGDSALASRLIEANPALARERDEDAQTPLMHAVVDSERLLVCVEALIPLSRLQDRDRRGMTALMWAAQRGTVESLRLLLRGSNVFARDRCGNTALMHASVSCDPERLSILLPHSEPSCVNKKGWNALMCTAQRVRGFDCARLLAPHCDPLARNARGETAFEMAQHAARNHTNGKDFLDFLRAAEEQALLRRTINTTPHNTEPSRVAGACGPIVNQTRQEGLVAEGVCASAALAPLRTRKTRRRL